MPQSLIEAMARKKIVVSSKSEGGKEIISDNKNGFLFEIGNPKQLSEIINKIQKSSETSRNKIQNNAKESVMQFSWDKLIKKIEAQIVLLKN